MGKTNSKLPTLPTLPPPSTSTSFNPGIVSKPLRKESVLKKKILTNERKMVIYNICPNHLTHVKNYRRLETLFSKRKYHIRSLQIEANSPLLGDLKLLKIFHKLRNLNSLEIEFSRVFELSINKMKSLAKTLSSLKQLKHCRIKNDDPDEISLKGSYLLMTGLSKLHNLKQVDLAWTTWMVKKAHEKLLARLVLRTLKLRKAEKFALDLSSCGDLTNEVLTKFGEKLSRLHKIRELSLDLRHNEEISRDEINSVVEKLARLKLSSLELKLGGNVISEEKDIFAVCWILPKFEKLEKISLTFEGIQDTRQKVIGYLVENLNQLKLLKELTLNLSGCKDLTNFEGFTLVEDITFFERLRKLHLDLSFCSLSDAGLVRLSKSFVRLEKLEDLCLSFRGQETATDHSLVSLGQHISQIKGLKYLEFDYSKTLITDQGLDHFMHHVSKLGQLKSLTLHFTMNKNITDKGVSALGRHLNNLQGLVKLDIDLCHCPQIKDQGVIALTRAVGTMRSLMQPKLRLYHCGTFSRGVEAMLKPYAQKGKR